MNQTIQIPNLVIIISLQLASMEIRIFRLKQLKITGQVTVLSQILILFQIWQLHHLFLNITLISIVNTTLAFCIEDNWLSGGLIAIALQNVTAGYIENNIIQGCTGYGIEISQSPQISINNNLITNIQGLGTPCGIYCIQSDQTLVENNNCTSSAIGIWLDECMNCSINANWVENNQVYGIYTANQGENFYENNNAHDNGLAGMRFLQAGNDFIAMNNMSFNGDGISFSGNTAGHNYLTENYVYNNIAIGIDLESTPDNTIFNNTVTWSGSYGLSTDANNDIPMNISYNMFYMNYFPAIDLANSQNVILQFNNFLDNGDEYGLDGRFGLDFPHQQPPQIEDDAVKNISLSYNFWGDWITQITVDGGLYYTPNVLDENMTDSFPMVRAYLNPIVDALTYVKLFCDDPKCNCSSSSNCIYQEAIQLAQGQNFTIERSSASDTFGNPVNFSLYAINDVNQSFLLTSNWNQTTFVLSANMLPMEHSYYFEVIVQSAPVLQKNCSSYFSIEPLLPVPNETLLILIFIAFLFPVIPIIIKAYNQQKKNMAYLAGFFGSLGFSMFCYVNIYAPQINIWSLLAFIFYVIFLGVAIIFGIHYLQASFEYSKGKTRFEKFIYGNIIAVLGIDGGLMIYLASASIGAKCVCGSSNVNDRITTFI